MPFLYSCYFHAAVKLCWNCSCETKPALTKEDLPDINRVYPTWRLCVCRGGEGRRGEGWGRHSLNGGHTHHYQVVSRSLLKLLFFCCKDEHPKVLYMNWDWFRYYIVNMFLASNDNINKRITLHECFNFERQSWHEPGNLEVKNVSPYSLSTSYRRGSWLLIFSSFSCFCCVFCVCVCVETAYFTSKQSW